MAQNDNSRETIASELQKAICIIEDFENGSGLAVNREKSEILEL
jgi:hypothetical protein